MRWLAKYWKVAVLKSAFPQLDVTCQGMREQEEQGGQSWKGSKTEGLAALRCNEKRAREQQENETERQTIREKEGPRQNKFVENEKLAEFSTEYLQSYTNV